MPLFVLPPGGLHPSRSPSPRSSPSSPSRPPDVADVAEVVDGLVPVGGRELRHGLLVVLDRAWYPQHSVADLVVGLAALGLRPDSPRPGKAVADALRWEIRRGRVLRLGWGRYGLGRLPRTSRWRAHESVRLVRELHGPCG